MAYDYILSHMYTYLRLPQIEQIVKFVFGCWKSIGKEQIQQQQQVTKSNISKFVSQDKAKD